MKKKEGKVHLLIPAFSENMLRVACRSRDFTHYTRWTNGVTCKRCMKTQIFKEYQEKEKL